ncbi:MAG: hypothetical protein GY782_03895, partial [Gammaproteobacteria bacterium]|nr:hypothetical protein [Gammaproteobacteria bacterium]
MASSWGGGVISVIIFVMVMNLSDEYLSVKIPRAIQYHKGDTPVPVMKLFMDDACLSTALSCDMMKVLLHFKQFVDWARFKLKASKSRALVFKSGKAIEWFVDGVEDRSSNSEAGLEEEVVEKIRIEGDVVPNVCEKPIKFLGRWIRADAKDTVIIEDTRKDLVGYLEKL